MFGYVRLILASLVLASHTMGGHAPFNVGVVSVVLFYLLAGFVVTGLLTNTFKPYGANLVFFYGERTLRIFPMYLFMTFVTLVFVSVSGFGGPVFDFWALIANLTVMPLTYFMYVDTTILTQPHAELIPYGWSLGVELHAYLILPFVVRYKGVKIVVGIASLVIYTAAVLGMVNTNYFGYMLPPGVLFIFVLGSMIYKRTFAPETMDEFDRHFPRVTYGVVLALALWLTVHGMLLQNFATETLSGILLGYPLVAYLAKREIKLPYNGLMGDLSYGVFLSHAFAIWVLEHIGVISSEDPNVYRVATVLVVSFVIAVACSFVVERNMKAMRFGLSRKAKERAIPSRYQSA